MRTLFGASLFIAIALATSTITCIAPDLTGFCDLAEAHTPAEQQAMLQRCSVRVEESLVDIRRASQVDVLFVVANTPSMVPKQKQLADSIGAFVAELDRDGTDYHIGVISTDIGAQVTPGASFQPGNRNAPGCASFWGDDGELQNKLCTQRDQSAWSSDAKAACTSVCTNPRGLAGGDRFLYRWDGLSNAPNQDVAGTLRCMLMLGDGGCTMQSPLEAAKRALDDHSTTNSGFLRRYSHLFVIFVTDEDDCSVKMSARSQNHPDTIDCTGNTMSVLPSACWNSHYRCLANSIRCNESLTIPGLKTGCVQSDTGYLEPVDKYVRFFSNLRPSEKLSLVGLWTPAMLDNLSGDLRLPGKLTVDYDDSICIPGAGVTCPTSALDTGKGTAAACSGVDPRNTGRAQLRLSSFVRNFPITNRSERSICTADYGPSLQDALDTRSRISHGFFPNCLAGKPRLDSLGNPRCVVGLVDESQPSAAPDVAMPRCGATCCRAFADAGGPTAPSAKPVTTDPTIVAACRSEPSCYCAVPNPGSSWACKDTRNRDTAVAGIWLQYPARQLPSEKVVKIFCAVEAR